MTATAAANLAAYHAHLTATYGFTPAQIELLGSPALREAVYAKHAYELDGKTHRTNGLTQAEFFATAAGLTADEWLLVEVMG